MLACIKSGVSDNSRPHRLLVAAFFDLFDRAKAEVCQPMIPAEVLTLKDVLEEHSAHISSMTTMLRNSLTRDRQTYAAIMAARDAFAVASNKSVKAASRVAP